MARLTCPTCDGEGMIEDLTIIDFDLSYSLGNLRGPRPFDPAAGFPKMACFTCKGQGWMDDQAITQQFDIRQFALTEFA